MTKQTSSQVNKTYRAKRAATLARYEAALREIAKPIDGVVVGDPWAFYADLQIVARQALNPDAKDV